MRIAILGASGKTGQHVVREGLARGHEIVGVCRPSSVPKLNEFADRITVVPGMTNDREVVRQAVEGCDGVITVIIAPSRFSKYASETVTAALEEAPKARHVFTGSDGASAIRPGERRNLVRWLEMFIGVPIGFVTGIANVVDMHRATRVIYDSPGRWTVVRPPWLKEGESEGPPAVGKLGDKHIGGSIRRVDFARYMLDALEDESLVGEAPAIGRTREPKVR